jgi:hypothetical protein
MLERKVVYGVELKLEKNVVAKCSSIQFKSEESIKEVFSEFREKRG